MSNGLGAVLQGIMGVGNQPTFSQRMLDRQDKRFNQFALQQQLGLKDQELMQNQMINAAKLAHQKTVHNLDQLKYLKDVSTTNMANKKAKKAEDIKEGTLLVSQAIGKPAHIEKALLDKAQTLFKGKAGFETELNYIRGLPTPQRAKGLQDMITRLDDMGIVNSMTPLELTTAKAKADELEAKANLQTVQAGAVGVNQQLRSDELLVSQQNAQIKADQLKLDQDKLAIDMEKARQKAMTDNLAADTEREVIWKDGKLIKGDAQLVPGSAAYKEEVANQKAMARASFAAIQDFKMLKTRLDKAFDLADWTTTGVAGYLSGIPYLPAKKLAGELKKLKASNVLEAMKELKRLSPTGATGLGAISEKELDILENHIANLDQTAREDVLKGNLTETLVQFQNILSRIDTKGLEAFQEAVRNNSDLSPYLSSSLGEPKKVSYSPLIKSVKVR